MKVSCLVSAYYAEDFIEGRIENLLDQQGVDFEVLVSCAEDSTEEIILQQFEDRITVITTEGIPTLYATWNELIKVAKGKYLTNANSDDRLYPGALAFLADKLDSNPKIAIAYANTDVVKEIDGDPVNRHLWRAGKFFDLVHGCFIGPMPMWRKTLHETHGLFDSEMHSSGDYEFWLRVFHYGETAVHSSRVIGAYTSRSDQLEKREDVRTVVETARARSRYVDWVHLYD